MLDPAAKGIRTNDPEYSHLQDIDLKNGVVSVWQTHSTKDDDWDAFLSNTPLGEYAQSSIWARYKSIDSWQCQRVLLYRNKTIIGGFQLLWRATRIGRIGYVSKGPVLEHEDKQQCNLMKDILRKTAHRLKLAAMIIQAPGHSAHFSACLPKNQFFPEGFMQIIAATLEIDVTRGISHIESQMRRTTRQQVRKALRSEVRVREGEEKDIETFFNLMIETCKRQKVTPNPSKKSAIVRLWQAAKHSSRDCRLTIAEYQGQAISALFCIPFGKTLTLWKKGSLPNFLHLRSMELLYYDAFKWAASKKFQYCDFGALNRSIAESLSNGLPIPEELKRSRDIFNLGFGGMPVLFPKAYIHFINPIYDKAYRIITANQQVLHTLKNYVGLRSQSVSW